MIVFEKLWVTMKKRGISTYQLREKCGIDSKTIRRLRGLFSVLGHGPFAPEVPVLPESKVGIESLGVDLAAKIAESERISRILK